MTPFRALALVLVVLLVATAATPARAEAMETTTMLLIATAGVAIIIVIAFLIVANMSERKQAGGVPADGPPDGSPIGGTRSESAPIGGTAVAVTSYVVTPAPAEPVAFVAAVPVAVQGQ